MFLLAGRRVEKITSIFMDLTVYVFYDNDDSKSQERPQTVFPPLAHVAVLRNTGSHGPWLTVLPTSFHSALLQL